MKKYIALLLALSLTLIAAGCSSASTGNSADPGSDERGGRPYAPYIGDDVTKVEIMHVLGGQAEEWTAEGDDVDALRDWAAGLKYEHKTYEEGQTPGDSDGGETYEFTLTEGDYPGFTYINNGPNDCHLVIEGEWFSVSNPSIPPVDAPTNAQNENDSANGEIPKSPPSLVVIDTRNGKETAALSGTYSWTYPNGDGTSTGVEACGAGPLECRDMMPALDANGATVELTFSIAPDELTVRCWSADSWGNYDAVSEEIAVSGGKIDLYPDSRIYEVTAKWNSSLEWGGTAYYSFYSGPASELSGIDLGITLTAKDVTPAGLTLVCTQSGGSPTGELMTGAPFWLESWVDGNWEPTPRDMEEVAFTSEGWMIPMNDSVEWTVNLEWLYPNLGAGRYRIGKSVMDFRGTGDYDTYKCYAEFELP